MNWTNIDTSKRADRFVSFLDTFAALDETRSYKKRAIASLDLQPGDAVLDVGCGTGEDIFEISRLIGPGGRAVGIDSSETMLFQAAARAEQGGVRVKFQNGDAEKLPFENELFDKCRCDRVLQHLANPHQALAEMARVTKSGGIVFASEPDWESLEITSNFPTLVAAIKAAVCRAIPNPTMGRRLTKCFARAGLVCEEVQSATLKISSLAAAKTVLCLDDILSALSATGVASAARIDEFVAEQTKFEAEGLFLLAISGMAVKGRKSALPCFVNDVHSQLNKTSVKYCQRPASFEELKDTLRFAADTGAKMSIAGGRHAMGAQQFASAGILLDTAALSNIIHFDNDAGLLEVEAGILWPDLIRWLQVNQRQSAQPWAIAQKQTGCDRLSLGGAISANVHGRGLMMKPLVGDLQSFKLLKADGRLVNCSRQENYRLFQLAAGGYGLFGVIYSVTLQLVKRTMLRRDVGIINVDELALAFRQRISDGARYGDFQFAIDSNSADFLRKGILSTYTPVADQGFHLPEPKLLTESKWRQLLYLAHTDKKLAFEKYSQHYLSTDRQLYWSDSFQLSTYIDDYHREFDASTKCKLAASEVITELYVPPHQLASFLGDAAQCLRRARANVIYGTVRLIEKDDETFLPWARQKFACTVFNLHTDHDKESLERTAAVLIELIDLALSKQGSFYLTYHKHARKDQIEACYPQFGDFLLEKLRYDPDQLFESNWYRHYRSLFAR